MFVFQAKKQVEEKHLHPFVYELIKRTGFGFSDEQKQQLADYVEKKGESAENNKLDIYFAGKLSAEDFKKAIEDMKGFIKQYGVEIKVSIEKKEGYYVAHMERFDIPQEKPSVIPTKTITIQEKPSPRPTATMDDVEKRAQELREKGYQGVEIVDSEEEAKKKLGEFPKGSETVLEKYTIKTGVDDTLREEDIKKYKYATVIQGVQAIIHSYGYYFENTGTYSIPKTQEGALNIRNNAGDAGGFGAYMYSSYVDFMKAAYRIFTNANKKGDKKNAEKFNKIFNDPFYLAAYLCRGYTGVLSFKDETGKLERSESKTINMHRKKIQTLVDAYGTFDGIRGTIPDDLWVSFRAFSLALADYAINLGVIDKNRKNEYADAFAFGMLAQIWHESGLTLDQFFQWLREETDMEIDPDKVITTIIMKERDKCRLFYGDQEITEKTVVKASPYKDLLITREDGKTPIAHLRISHPKWLYVMGAWDGNSTYKDLINGGVFITTVEKWSWLGIGGTAYYHPIETEIHFRLTKEKVEDKYIIGYKPVKEEEKPKAVNAFSIVGDREFRLVGTQFKTNGTIIAYGYKSKSINDLKNDPNFSLDYVGIAVPKGKENIAYLVLPAGDHIKDRLPSVVDTCEEGIQNGALVYEDYRYDLILTINGKRINVLPGISKYLIDKGLKPEHLNYEINPDNTIDIFVYIDKNGRPSKNPTDHVEVIASGVKISEDDLNAIRGKPISNFASFEDNGRTGLDLYAVVKINKDGTKTLVDAARIAGHEFDYKWLHENNYRKMYLCSLPSSRVVVSESGERSYHIMPTDIPPEYRDLLVGTIPRELITASADGKSGAFTAMLDEHVAVQKGIGKYVVSYWMNYTDKPQPSFEFANLPVSVETLTSKDANTRKSAIAQLVSLSQNPMSREEASNYIGLISEVEAKWKDRLDKEDRRNLAEARANFERYSGMVGAGERAAGVSERIPTTIGAPTPPTIKPKEEFPAPRSVIPTDLFVGELTEERIEGAFFNLWSALFTDAYMRSEGKPASERVAAVREYMKAFMNNLGLPTAEKYGEMLPEEKESVRYKLFANTDVDDDTTMKLLNALYSGDIDTVMQILKGHKQSPLLGAFEGMSNVKIYIPRQMVVTVVGGTVFTFESEGYKGGKLGAPQKGLMINASAFVDFIRELYMERSLDINFEDATITLNEKALERYGVEPKVKARIEERLAGGEELYAEGTIGLRFIFDNRGRLQTTYGTPELTVGVGNIRIGNVIVAIEGDYTKLPVFQGTVDRYTLEGKANFLLLVPWEVKAGGRITAGERTAFAVVAAKVMETEGGALSLEPFVGAEAKGMGELQKWGAGTTIGTPYGSSRFGVWRTKDNWVLDVGIGVEF
jgi:hypothetical protein